MTIRTNKETDETTITLSHEAKQLFLVAFLTFAWGILVGWMLTFSVGQ